MQQLELKGGHVLRVRRSRPHLCECGCGLPTKMSDRTWAKYGMVKGRPLRFLKGHNGHENAIDLTGAKFGRLTVKRLEGRSASGVRLWRCGCTCGEETVVHAGALTTGHTRSCGCLKNEGYNARHGMARDVGRHPVWAAWHGMVQRCTCTSATNYKDYGGRGISVCERWSTFEHFRDDMLSSWFVGGTLERKDNGGNYTPDNCRWATKKEQARNRRTTNWVEVFGETISLAEAVERYGVVGYGTVRQRIYRDGWGAEDALVTSA